MFKEDDDFVQIVMNKEDFIKKKFHLNDKEFGLLVHWFNNEPKFDGRENDMVPVTLNINFNHDAYHKLEDVENYIVVPKRLSDGIEYARQGGFDLDDLNMINDLRNKP